MANYTPGMNDINEVVKGLQSLNEIVCHKGHWLNLNEFLKFTQELPALVEHAMEAQAYMQELISEEYRTEVETMLEQEKMNYEHREVLTA